jgi:Spy/CpxP family protein refolding chaperone
MLPQERAEQLQELLGLTDAQATTIKQILQASRKVIDAEFEAEEETRFSMRSATRKILKEGDQQILAILDSKQKEQFVAMRKQQPPERGVQSIDGRGLPQPGMGMIPKGPFRSGSATGPMRPEIRPSFGGGVLPEASFSPMRSMFAADRAAVLQDRLGLTDAQTSNIESLFRNQEKKIRMLKESSHDSLETLHTKLVKERREVDNKIAELLTDEQQQKYSQIRSHPLDLPTVEDRPHFEY